MKITASRRKFFGFMAAAPMASRAAAEELIAKQAQISVGQAENSWISHGMSPGWAQEPSQEQWGLALKNPTLRELIESSCYRAERRVGAIDPDIACMRSFSLNAKIAFQRQRNVGHRIASMSQEYPWQTMIKKVRATLEILA